MSGAAAALVEALARGLEDRAATGLLRALVLPGGIDLTSNDTLGYATDRALAAAVARRVAAEGAGGAASRLLRGHTALLAEAEAALAAFSGQPSALLFSSGYAANVGLLSALLGPEDVALSDALNHASLIDGLRLSGAQRRVVPHLDLGALEAALVESAGARRRIVVLESLYSMDGDQAPLASVLDLADAYGAAVVVDEAHATGLYGARGSGLVEQAGLSARVLCTVHTGGKALGVGGAWVAGPKPLIEHLLNHARSFVYSTAPVPAVPAGLLAALERRAGDEARVAALHAESAWLRARLRAAGVDLGPSGSHILPVILGDPARALQVAARLQARGWDVRAVRPPTVPSSRLRVSLKADMDRALLSRFADDLLAAL